MLQCAIIFYFNFKHELFATIYQLQNEDGGRVFLNDKMMTVWFVVITTLIILPQTTN